VAEFSPKGASGLSLQRLSAKIETMKWRRAVFNRTFDELSGLTDAELAQMKLSRSMIRQVAQSAALRTV
jgi:hypothetical protein